MLLYYIFNSFLFDLQIIFIHTLLFRLRCKVSLYKLVTFPYRLHFCDSHWSYTLDLEFCQAWWYVWKITGWTKQKGATPRGHQSATPMMLPLPWSSREHLYSTNSSKHSCCTLHLHCNSSALLQVAQTTQVWCLVSGCLPWQQQGQGPTDFSACITHRHHSETSACVGYHRHHSYLN